MLYHARALADSGARVTLIGREGSSLPDRFLERRGIRVKLLPARPPRAGVGIEAGRWVAETGRLLVRLLRAAPDVILLQAPPLFPAVLAALAASNVCDARLVVDWHNLGDGLLALRPRGSGAPAGLLAALEGALGRKADAHLAVSAELAAALRDRRDIPGARVFRDRPHERFSVPTAADAGAFRAGTIAAFDLPFREPLLLALSPTSWGRDEDLDQLLAAAEILAVILPGPARPILLLASGDGEGRRAFEARAGSIRASRVAVRTIFVPGDAYCLLVRSADVGISLHRPSAGLDPPMKIADLLGAGIPVLELRGGPRPSSLVVPGENGLAFHGPAELAGALAELASNHATLAALAEGARRSGRPSFGRAWASEVAPVLLGNAR